MSESDERFVHRIEAFSDIVIGFTLAQLGAQLVVTGHPGSLLTDPGWFFNFLWTFAVVCGMWWLHNRLFRTIFAPTAASVMANFALLASIVILVYFAEEMAHAASPGDFVVGQRLYDCALSACSLFVALITFLGMRERAAMLASDILTRSKAVSFVNVFAALFLLLTVAVSFVPVLYAWSPPILGLGIPAAYYLGRTVGRTMLRSEFRSP